METTTYNFEQWARDSTPGCVAYTRWAEGNSNVKICTTEIPSSMFAGLSVKKLSIHDIRLATKKRFRKRGGRSMPAEDFLYEEFPAIRRNVARGNTLLSGELSNGTKFTTFPLRGLKKFTGGLGDEDEANDGGSPYIWKKFFIAPLETTTQIISSTKENGSAAHLAVVKIDESFLLIGGSKNVHLLVRSKDDLKFYTADMKWKLPVKILTCIFDFLDSLDTTKRLRFLNYLATTHQTACFEILDPEDQHVEHFTFDSPRMQFISFCPQGKFQPPPSQKKKTTQKLPQTSENNQDSLCTNPKQAYEIASELGLSVVKYDVITINHGDHMKIDKLLTDTRQLYGIEGKVLYFVDENNRVIGLLKKKSTWYIMLRAIREKMKEYLFVLNKSTNKFKNKMKGSAMKQDVAHVKTNMPQKLERRMNAIQNWLKLDDKTVQSWLTLGKGFSEWIYYQIGTGGIDVSMLGNRFPILWNKYLENTSRTDRIMCTLVHIEELEDNDITQVAEAET